MTLPYERTRSVINAREFLFRLSTPYIETGETDMREHWLEHAHGRIVAGDDELDVLLDYGWVQITAEEREAIRVAILEMDTLHSGEFAKAETLRKLLERLTLEKAG